MGGKELEDEEYIWGYGWHADGQMNVGGGGNKGERKTLHSSVNNLI